MYGIHAQRLADGKENRGEDKAGRRHVHKGSHNQQQNVDNKKNHIAVGADSQHGLRYSGGDAGEGHDPAHDAGYSDKEDDNACHLCAVQKNLRQLPQPDGLVKEDGQDHAVYHGYHASFGGRENAGNDAANDNNNHEQTRDGLEKYLHLLRTCITFGAAVSFLPGKEVNDHHTRKSPEYARNIACHEKGCHGGAAADQGKGNHYIAGGNQKAGGSCGNVGCRGKVPVISFLLLDGADDGSHGRSSRCTGAGNGSKEHVGHGIGVGQGAGNAAGEQLGKVD